ncbi:putative tail fiber protein [Candidatus Burkholderia humilis]|nr:putative tail fiber protein [Candidatus Burkholderia humilis]
MTIAGHSVRLNPESVSALIEQLSNVRASMSPEQPMGVVPGWQFAATKNPVMATQKYANGDRLLLMRHGGHGWVPFKFSPNMVIELYAMLTKK